MVLHMGLYAPYSILPKGAESKTNSEGPNAIQTG